MDNVPGTIYRCRDDKDRTVIYVSAGIADLSGYKPAEIVSNDSVSFQTLIHPADLPSVERAIIDALAREESWNVEYRLQDRNGVFRWVSDQGVGIRDDAGKVNHLDGFISDISDRRAIQEALNFSEEKVRRLAYLDSVTGLPNRNLIFQEMEHRLSNTTFGELPFALMFIDLDGFKPVNDRFGHCTGDKVLKILGHRIGAHLEPDDIVARIGGDEFLVLVQNSNRVDLNSVGHQIVQSISRPIDIPNKLNTKIVVTASMGVATYPDIGRTRDELLAGADTAMYEAKRLGKNQVVFARSTELETIELKKAA